MSKFKVWDEIIWEDTLIESDTKTATIIKIEDGQYFYIFCGGTCYQYDVQGLDEYSGVRLLTPLDKLL